MSDTNLTSTVISHGNTSKRLISFTYDTGNTDLEANEILNVLKKHNVKCTFFVTGIWAKTFPSLILRMLNEGHEIGNHSFDHPDMTKLTYENMIKTILDGKNEIKSIAGINPTLFRIPYGSFNNEVLKSIYSCGYKYNIYWNIDTLDWKLPSVKFIVSRILRKPKNGDIVLMHIGGKNTAEATDIAISNLTKQNFNLVTIGEILK